MTFKSYNMTQFYELQDLEPVCKMSPKIRRRSSVNAVLPSHDPYIPRNNTILYNCSEVLCSPIAFTSMIELTSPHLNLKSCFIEITKEDEYACEPIRYHHFKNIDKLLFLSKTIRKKSFYLVDCLVYSDSGRVCHRKEDVDSHAKLVDIGTMVRPNETNVLSQEEFICEEDEAKSVQCDLNPFVPFEDGLKKKQAVKFDDNVLLKTQSYVIELKRECLQSWCGYSGQVAPTRRGYGYPYVPPGGQVFRCFYANKQQVCKQVGYPKQVYNERSWLERT